MSFFRYPGGKSKLKKEITEQIILQNGSRINQYREPFWGGGSIGIALVLGNVDINSMWINDKDIGIASLWTSVIQYSEEFEELIQGFEPSVDKFYQFKKYLLGLQEMPSEKEDIVSAGFKKLAIHQMSYSGLGTKSGSPLGGAEQESAYKIDCRWSPTAICKKINKIYYKLSSIEIHNNCCTNLSFEEVLADETQPSFLYLDPPYYEQGNNLYQCGFTEENHILLADMLKETMHDWVLSYDDCSEIRELYNWAEIRQLNVNYSIVTKTKEDTSDKKELLILPQGDE